MQEPSMPDSKKWTDTKELMDYLFDKYGKSDIDISAILEMKDEEDDLTRKTRAAMERAAHGKALEELKKYRF
jgi:hypothetical protein